MLIHLLFNAISSKHAILRPCLFSNVDTKAEVLWRMDLFDEAIKVIDEAISIDSEYKYYQEQRDKFKKSKSEININSI